MSQPPRPAAPGAAENAAIEAAARRTWATLSAGSEAIAKTNIRPICEHTFVRWDNLIDEEQRHLPGYRDPAVVRTFDAPEALGTRFYEVRAKSALNRVPAQSQMPFRWTINPYRGCSHACAYCATGDTPILMADGRTKPLADLRVGDRIYGTVRRRRYRRYVAHRGARPLGDVEAGVPDHARGRHRARHERRPPLPHERGWKHVTGASRARDQRPHLTLNNELLGTGGFAAALPSTPGLPARLSLRDGPRRRARRLATRTSVRAAHGDHHRFRLALADFEALRPRTRVTLPRPTSRPTSSRSPGERSAPARAAIRTQSREPRRPDPRLDRVAAVGNRRLVPGIPRRHLRCGGQLHRAASCGSPNTDSSDHRLDNLLPAALRLRLRRRGSQRTNGADVRPDPWRPREHLRFFHLDRPGDHAQADDRGRLRSSRDASSASPRSSRSGVELPMYDITTGTGDFIANGVVSHNCFARPTHNYLDLNAGRDFEREIVVKVNAARGAAGRAGAAVVEGRARRAGHQHRPLPVGRGALPAHAGHLGGAAGRRQPVLGPHQVAAAAARHRPAEASSPSARRSARVSRSRRSTRRPGGRPSRTRRTRASGSRRSPSSTGPASPPACCRAADARRSTTTPRRSRRSSSWPTAAGATHIGGIALHLRGEVRDIWFDWLRAHRPDLVPRYERAVPRAAPTRPRRSASGWASSSRSRTSAPAGATRTPRGRRHRASAAASPTAQRPNRGRRGRKRSPQQGALF